MTPQFFYFSMIEPNTEYKIKIIEVVAKDYNSAIEYINSIPNRSFSNITQITQYKFEDMKATFLNDTDSNK